MARNPRSEPDPPLGDVLTALDDADCRAIIRALDEPLSAGEVSERCDIPSSTAYRKLDLLTEADLLREATEVRPDGHHTTLYEVDFERVVIALDEDRSLEVGIDRPTRSADEQLAAMWKEVRRET
ncbi:winged helix-turn-helix domain-containing protein [Haloglomus halophilum]|uniref:winged helix-turn-helix domain-containing protein n=1 Tax=Haloglomus halophilum TaxID=2962672 RepID=UPI0020CA2358|nr:helix-turn-helix domain-containing protein [Haloglomus halophilum]